MKRLLVVFAIVLAAVSCGKKNDVPNVQKKVVKVDTVYKPSSRVCFSGLWWKVLSENNPEFANGFKTTDSSSVGVNAKGELVLSIRSIDGVWFGSEVVADTVLGYGSYIYVCNSPMNGLDYNSAMSLGVAYVGRKDPRGMTETGVSYSSRCDSNETELVQHYMYSSNKKFAGVFTPEYNFKRENTGNIFKITVSQNSIEYFVYAGTDFATAKLLNYKKITSKDKLNPDDGIDALMFAKTKQSIAPMMKLALYDLTEPKQTDKLTVTVSRFVFVPEQASIVSK